MARLGVRYLIFWLFLAGICIIVFFQVISGHNTNRLISGNRNLLAELSYQKEIRRLEADVLTIESDIRGAVITQDSSHLTNIQNKIQTVQTGLDSLKKHIGTRSSYNLDLLSGLVQEKINFSYKILIAFKQEGKAAAEVVVNTNRGKILRDSIVMITSGIDSVRQAELQKIYGGIEKTGKRARVWGFVFSGFALLLVVFAFVYILNKGRQQTRMIEALNEAEKRNREAAILKEQFLANMSHEIRTPINAILGFTNLLKRTDLNSDQKQFVRNINSSGENLLVIINDILDLSKIESGMIHFEKNEFSLRSLISSVSSMFSVKFTERGIISLEVNTVTVRKNKARLQFIVADTGIGISPDKQQSIFERFQQAEAETTRRYGGTGLGLSIVRELVERQGGDIRLESEQGKGSKFFIELEYEVLGQQSGPQENVQPEILEGRIDQARLLIAEDNYMNQQLIEFLMRKWNIDYDLVGNGNEAVEAVKRNEYSLILMDIQMPEMDGYNATEIIRKEVGSEVPIIAMTAHAMAGEKEKCIRLGMNDYISKPIKEQLLHDLILQHALQNVEVPDGEKLINLNYLHELSGNDPEFEKQILQQFVIQTPKELSDLQNAIEKGDALQVKRIAHSLKSTVGYVGMAEQLHPALERLEKWSENGSGLNDFQLVKARCSKAFAEVQQLLNSNQ
jgi:CheY-like chemotaxis protein/CHASE3 domain sensor protein